MGVHDRIRELEEELRTTKYNKRTQQHVGLVKAKLAKLKTDATKKGGGGKSEGYAVRKSGDATVALLGFPSVGKSTLLNQLTNANSAVAAYEFTTLDVIPGLLEYRHAKIQILDVPGIVSGAASGRGRGKEVLGVIRSADLILILVDALKPQQRDLLLQEVFDSGIRLNKEKPEVKLARKNKGGLSISTTVRLTKLKKDTIAAILREMGVMNADVVIREDITDDDLIDVIEGNRVYTPSVVLVNKSDLIDAATAQQLKKQIQPDLFISAHNNQGMEETKAAIFDRLNLIRIYLKEVGKKADLEEPLVMKSPCTIKNICTKLHKDFVKKFKFARVWGASAKFDGQIFRKIDKELSDSDILEIHLT